ncbi:Bifunctional thioredoxin reductase/thioredoxin [Seminavis robusta]|uniref:Bifunctional thioredoxin reductase/thioredoxin n=1 Tax=Seminavis robusta TaxID=568900 RepID=A0A9N8E8S1_9STRA|nr:Bifunctional thioredoxin reductase/thioredoxin [Seminavis robusta]|eukprot:Sro779_g201380.1 Bifunctional thioredoxin reductase/thioredoxin (486) ;mRNA; r:42120-43577
MEVVMRISLFWLVLSLVAVSSFTIPYSSSSPHQTASTCSSTTSSRLFLSWEKQPWEKQQWQEDPSQQQSWQDEEENPYIQSIRHFEAQVEQAEQEKQAVIQDIANSLQSILQQEGSGGEYKNNDNELSQPGEEQDNMFAAPEQQDDDDDDGLMMGMPEMVECDVAIVGGGPAGCTCALYTARARHKTVILDKNPGLGALAITSHIANYPGVDKSMKGDELLERIRSQAIDYGADYRRAQVFMIDTAMEENGETRHTVYTPDAVFKTRALVFATGAMGRVAKPFPGEDEFLGQGVSYCATCDGAFYRGEDVAVKGMNMEAMEEAQFLTKFANTVHWVTPSRPRPDQSEHVRELLASGNVIKWPTTRFLGVEGDAVKGVTGIKVKQKQSDEPEVIPVTGVFIYAGGGGGSKPITDYVSSNIDFKEDGGVIVNEEMETNVKGVYAIGDIRNTNHKQVVVAAADGCIAAMSIDKYLAGRENVKVDWIHK